jgi:hypothetical protein
VALDPLFTAAGLLPKNFRSKGKHRQLMAMEEPERYETVMWVSQLADSLGGWKVAGDWTFGTGNWQGRRHGRRKDLRDALLVVEKRRRGFDPDDSLDLYRKFMHRVAPSVSWFAAVERNPDHGFYNEGNHLHSMLAGADDIYRRSLHDAWVSENGWCKVNPIRSRVEAENYCTKHLVGRGLIFGYEIRSADVWSQLQSAL